MFRDYAECEIHILARAGEVYPVLARTPGGDASGQLRLPVGDPAFHALYDRLEGLDTDEHALSLLGGALFTALFTGDLADAYARAQGVVQADAGRGLRLKLTIDAPEAAALPWELLYDPARGPLALLDVSIVRHLPQAAAAPRLAASLPLRVLLTGAETGAGDEMRGELEVCEEALQRLGDRVEVTIEPHLTALKLQRLLRERFHVWQFVGRGAYDVDGTTGQLLLEGGRGPDGLSVGRLGVLLNRSGVRLILLNAGGSDRLATRPLQSLAAALIRAQIPAVVAMQFDPAGPGAWAFAYEFYAALAEGFPIDACVTEGRKAVMNAAGLGQPDWATPVVFSRAQDGRLFDLSPPAPPQPHAGISVPGDVAGDVALGPIVKGGSGVTITDVGGASFGQAPARPALARRRPPRVPRPPELFLDRQDELAAIRAELRPAGGAWLHGPPGCGLTALLLHALTLPEAAALADGAVYLDGEIEPETLDAVVLRLFECFYAADPGVRIGQEQARTSLGEVRAAFALDGLRLGRHDLVELANILSAGAVLIAAEGAAPDTLADVPLGPLPTADAAELIVHFGANVLDGPAVAAVQSLVEQLADRTPLPIVLLGRLARRAIPLGQLLAAFAETHDGWTPHYFKDLERAARLATAQLRPDEQAALRALVESGPSGVSVNTRSLHRAADLGLIEWRDEAYTIRSRSLRAALHTILSR